MSETLINKLYHLALDGATKVPEPLLLLVLFIAAVLQIIVPPVPGDAALPTMGALSVALSMKLKYYGLEYLVSYWMGTYLACIAVFELGRSKGPAVMETKLFRKLIPERVVARARGFISRHGGLVLLGTKFVPGVNTATVAMAGAMDTPRAEAYPAMAVATLLHNGLLFMVGRWLGDNFWAIASAVRGIGTFGLVLMLLGVALLFFTYSRFVRGHTGEVEK